MKNFKYLLLPVALLCINTAEASAKQVNLPFTNEALFSKNHEGLFFNYDMADSSAKKIVCELSYVYKGWLTFRNQNAPAESGTYGNADGIDKITLTSKGASRENQYHADPIGDVRINAVQSEKAPHASASCHYEF